MIRTQAVVCRNEDESLIGSDSLSFVDIASNGNALACGLKEGAHANRRTPPLRPFATRGQSALPPSAPSDLYFIECSPTS
jgi:hypothetical protein